MAQDCALEDVKEQLADTRAKTAELAKVNERLRSTQVEQEAKRAELSAAVATREAASAEQTATIEQLRGELEAATATATEARQRVETLEQEAEEARGAAAAVARDAAAAGEAGEKELRERLAQVEQLRQQERRQLMDARAKVAALQADNTKLQAALDRVAELESELEVSRETHSEMMKATKEQFEVDGKKHAETAESLAQLEAQLKETTGPQGRTGSAREVGASRRRRGRRERIGVGSGREARERTLCPPAGGCGRQVGGRNHAAPTAAGGEPDDGGVAQAHV